MAARDVRINKLRFVEMALLNYGDRKKKWTPEEKLAWGRAMTALKNLIALERK